MKKLLVGIYLKLNRCFKSYEWKKQAGKRMVSLENAKSVEDTIGRDEGRILIVVPHPDDELIACHSIIQKYKERVLVFYSGLLGGNLSDENGKTRTGEFVRYCDRVGVNYCINTGDLHTELEKLISENDFRYVFVPSVVDWHEEHRLLFRYVVHIVQEKKIKTEILCYQVTVPIPEEYITHFSLMTKAESLKKWKCFKEIYISQRNMPLQRFRAAESAYLKNGKRVLAEVIMSLDEMCIAEEYACEICNKEINNLKSVMEHSTAEYRKAFHN